MWSASMEYNSTKPNTDLEQSITLNFFKERLKGYLFPTDDITFLSWFCVLYEDKDVS